MADCSQPTHRSGRLIFRASITTRDGRKIYARDYGMRGFPIWIDDELIDESERVDVQDDKSKED